MFRALPTADPPTHHDVVAPEQLVPLVVLELSLDAPAIGWNAYLAGNGVEMVTDDIGRPAIARADARMLIGEQRENEARKAEMRATAERAAVEADQRWRPLRSTSPRASSRPIAAAGSRWAVTDQPVTAT
jgi:hypothetical protein